MSKEIETKRARGVHDVVKSNRIYPQAYMKVDRKPAGPALLEESPVYLGSEDISVDRYLTAEFHDMEMEKVWRKTWQVACHESELSDVGDTVVYDIGRWSILVVRSAPDAVKGFYNSCLHRGTQLKCSDGPVSEFRCSFHGWTFSLDGKLTDLPEAWDFPHVDRCTTSLPQVKVAQWGGWIFINMDPDCVPLEEYLGPQRKQFEAIRPYRRYVGTHAVIRNLPCNWKVAQEAFFEVYHCDEVHPQFMISTNCYDAENSVYVDGGHLSSRVVVPVGVAGAGGHRTVTEQEVIDNLFGDRVRGQAALGEARAQLKAPQLAQGERARPHAAEAIRATKESLLGVDLSSVSDSEVMDAIEYFAFPNFMPWAGYQNCMAYRFRPDGNDPARSIMDVWLLNPLDVDAEKAPHAPEPVVLDGQKGVRDVEALGRFRVVLQQDIDNFHLIQKGMMTSAKGTVTLADYQEVRIRHFHQVLDQYLQRPDGER